MFSDDSIKWYIPRIWLNFLNLLTVESETHELRFEPVFLVTQKCETTIEVCAAHANSMPMFVECDDRCDYQIDVLRCNLCARIRLPQAIPVSYECGVGTQSHEIHSAVFVYDRGVNLFSHAPGTSDYGRRVDFVRHRQIADELSAGCKFVHANNTISDDI